MFSLTKMPLVSSHNLNDHMPSCIQWWMLCVASGQTKLYPAFSFNASCQLYKLKFVNKSGINVLSQAGLASHLFLFASGSSWARLNSHNTHPLMKRPGRNAEKWRSGGPHLRADAKQIHYAPPFPPHWEDRTGSANRALLIKGAEARLDQPDVHCAS